MDTTTNGEAEVQAIRERHDHDRPFYESVPNLQAHGHGAHRDRATLLAKLAEAQAENEALRGERDAAMLRITSMASLLEETEDELSATRQVVEAAGATMHSCSTFPPTVKGHVIDLLKSLASRLSAHPKLSDLPADDRLGASVAAVVEASEQAAEAGEGGEVEKLRAVVEKLPKTADGVPITPGMDLYRPRLTEARKVISVGVDTFAASYDGLFSRTANFAADSFYSTRAAADAELATKTAKN